ncbi:MAG: RsmB/NOP family class I SAM-dependent RNA methyltransferase [bacterium]
MAKGESRLPEALEERLEKQFGKGGLNSIIKAFGEKRLPTFRINTLRTTDEDVMAVLREESISYERVRGIPHAIRVKNRSDEDLLAHDLCISGRIYLQGVASMLPPLVLDPKAGESVLDMCAAPGSKTSEMAMMMKSGRLVALEENPIRFQKLQYTLKIQGADFVQAIHADATLAVREYPEVFDKVLVDAPCSAEGRIDLHDPRTTGFWSEKNIVAHAKLQRRLLRAAVGCLKAGGVMVYSTCTLAPEENELMVDWLTTELPMMKTEKIELPAKSVLVHKNKSVTVLPNVEHEGFFVAKLIKK